MSRLLLLTLLPALGLLAGCQRATPPGGASGSRPDAARKQAEKLALNAVNGAAEAQAEVFIAATTHNPNPPALPKMVIVTPSISSVPELPEPKSPPRAGPPPIIRERVISAVPSANESDAEKEAITAACDIIQRRLAELDPPVKYRPSENEVKNEFLRRDSKSVILLRDMQGPRADAMRRVLKEQLGLSNEEIARRVDVEYDVEVTADQVRHLRTRDRLGDALRVFGAFSVVALAGFLFLRADEWTKGYLTRWLAMGAVLLAGGAAAALYFV
jgi:hypothetical protein